MTSRIFVLAVSITLSLLLADRGRAAGPSHWMVSTQADFLKGEVDAVSIDETGRLTLGPETTLVADTAAPALWDMLPSAGGGYWLGSGNDGRVLRLDADGRTTTVFDAPELEVHALAPAPAGGVYAASSPDGKVYRIAADGQASVVFDPEEKYIWSLAVDSTGALYAGTGSPGRIYRIDPDGAARLFYDTRASNVVALAFDAERRLLAGTESPGRLFRIDERGKGFVLLDSPFTEIHAIRVDAAGVIYAGALRGRTEGPSPPAVPVAEPTPLPTVRVSSEITSFAVVDPAVSTATPAGGARPAPGGQPVGAVYRIAPDGDWRTVWESPEDSPYDIVVRPDGLVVATGDAGRLFLLTGDSPRLTLLTSADARQVTRLIEAADGSLLALTSNPGRLFRFSRGPASRGTYLSDVRDAKAIATWGVISWRSAGSGGLSISTRSGNTATPDDTWSEWSPAYRDPAGEPIVSPKARYLQWRAELASAAAEAGPALIAVSAAYLPRNQRPAVSALTVHPPGTVFQRPFPTGDVVELAGFEATPIDGRPGVGLATGGPGQLTLGRRLYQKGLQTFEWMALDPDNDTLQYAVFYREDGETAWKALTRAVWEPILVWDTTSVPDGTYTVKVVATDAPTNAPDAALAGERESATFEIDNTPPRIELAPPRRDARGTVVAFVVRDDHSPIDRVEYSLDAERWRAIYPNDGLPDSRVESFEILLAEGTTTPNLIIRATDAMRNVATAASGGR